MEPWVTHSDSRIDTRIDQCLPPQSATRLPFGNSNQDRGGDRVDKEGVGLALLNITV